MEPIYKGLGMEYPEGTKSEMDKIRERATEFTI